MMQLSTEISSTPESQPETAPQPSLKWDKCKEEAKQEYTRRLDCSLNESPSLLSRCNVYHCKHDVCLASIQAEHDNLTMQLKSADRVLPRHKPGVQKTWWTEELTRLKEKNVEIHRLWILEGKPGSGATNNERLRVRTAYRRALKAAQKAPIQSSWNRLHEAYSTKSTDQFWKAWKRQYNVDKSDLHPVVNGLSSKNDIADCFQTHFIAVSKPNNEDKVKEMDVKFSSKYEEAKSTHDQSCNCNDHRISLDTILDAIFSMKTGKSSDDDKISAEHFLNAPLSFFIRLQCLFNSMLRHSHVPNQFQLGTIVPIVKDHQGDRGDLHNYRGITIAPIASKIFEHVLKIVFWQYLSTSKFQFGFKKRSSTSHALFCLRSTINYYAENGSNVYCSFLDASKAFDRLVHSGLFLKMLQRNMPIIFVDIIIYWYSALQCRVRWGEAHSTWFNVVAGVRQGGVLSPDFYCIYIDDLVSILEKLNVGCYVREVFLSILLYADDMALVAPSLRGLQILLKACEAFCLEWDICLNESKTKNMAFGKKTSELCHLTLNGRNIQWVDTWKYLGVTLEASRFFNCSIDERLKSFYRCLNCITRIEGRSDELVMLRLLETHCVPILTYCIEILFVSNAAKRRRLRVAYNAVFRKIFHYRWNESVRELQGQLDRPTWEQLVVTRREKFHEKLRLSSAFAFLL